MKKMKCNYHTHTYRCMHALGKDEDYVKAAIAGGLVELGFSDHMPWPRVKGEHQHIRMHVSKIDNYISSIRALQEKYKDQIKIYVGLEAEYYKDRVDWLFELRDKYGIDYFIFGNHFHEIESWRNYMGTYHDRVNLCKHYYEDTVEALNTGLYSYYAHPDLFLRDLIMDDELRETSYKICELCKELDIPLEYNLEGLKTRKRKPLYYPRDEFWEIASEVGNKAIIGGDYHTPFDLGKDKYYQIAYEYLSGLGVEIIDKLEMPNKEK